MKIKYMLAIILIGMAGGELFAQKTYDLADCRQMAIENNRKIKTSQLEIKAAQEEKKNAFTNYFPSVSATGMGFKANDPMVSMNMGGASMNLLEDGWAGAVTLTQPIFTGGKIIYGNKMARLGIDMNEQQVRLSENDVLLQTESLYWELISLYEKMNTIEILDEQLVTLRKDVEASFEAGLITLNDVLQVKLKQNELKSNQVNLQNGISLCKMYLCQQMGLDQDHSEELSILVPDMNHVAPPADFYVNHREALFNRAESRLLEKNVEASRLQTKIKRADYLPVVAVGGTYYQQNMLDKWEGNSAMFVSVSIPMSNWWGGSHAIKKQRINEQIAHYNKAEGEEQLLLQMQRVRNELDNSYKQIQIANESIGQSTENLRLNNDYYRAGIVNLSDLLDAQTLLQQSRDKYVDAYADYQKKRFEYLQVTGR